MRSTAIAVMLCALMGPGPIAGACEPDTIGSPLSAAHNAVGVILGEAMGQTFYAADTLISSVAVWRVASQGSNPYGMRLFIANVDSAGAPQALDIIYWGDPLVVENGDGTPTKMEFTFSPPFSLPKRGTYEVGFSSCGGYWNILSGPPDSYLGGNSWWHYRAPFDDCPPRQFPRKLDGDLTFEIVFCDIATPAPSSSWGAVKARYR